MANSAAKDSVSTQLFISLSNPDEHSIFLNSTIQLSNTGPFDAVIHSKTAQVYWNDEKIGKFKLPRVKTKGNIGVTFQLLTRLEMLVKNDPQQTKKQIALFQEMVGSLLNGNNEVLKVKSSPEIDLKMGSITISTTVDLHNEMSLQGGGLQNAISAAFNIISATNNSLNGTADISFSSPAQMYISLTNVQMNIYNRNSTFIGYATMGHLMIKPGYNAFSKIPTQIVRFSNRSNEKAISIFLSNIMERKTQELLIRGPVASASSKATVISNVLDATLINAPLPFGDIVVSGMITSDSLKGWYLCNKSISSIPQELESCKHIQGAFTTIINPFPIDLHILAMSAHLYLKQSLFWAYDIPLRSDQCGPVLEFAHMFTGPGMYVDDPNRTDVYIAPNSDTSFFVIAEQFPDQFDSMDECFPIIFPEACCFLTMPLASICRINPQLKYNRTKIINLHKRVELTRAYIDMSLQTNQTLEIGEGFVINITYEQDFFPVFFGSQVYNGYISDMEINCNNIEILHDDTDSPTIEPTLEPTTSAMPTGSPVSY